MPRLAPASLLLALLLACGSDGGAVPGSPDAGDGDCSGGALCGQPAICCAAGSECVEGQCLALCESEVRCGPGFDVCCPSGDVCLADACATPGDPCGDSYDCPPGQFCEPTLDACVPQPDDVQCEVVPSFSDLDVTVEWSYEDHEIISIPVVTDVDGDGAPEVIVNLARQDGGDWPSGRIAILDGQSGAERVAPIPHDPASGRHGSHGRSTIAAADVSGDGLPDIVYASRVDGTFRSLIVAIDGQGDLLWTSHDAAGDDVRILVENGGATVANFDDDPEAEIVFGATLLDDDGTVVWDAAGDGSGGAYGSNQGSDSLYVGGISAVADLDGNGTPEIVSGKDAWEVDWSAGGVTVSRYWEHAGPDGYPAIADLDGDGVPEVVLVGSGTVRVLDGQSGQLFAGAGGTTQPLALPGEATLNRGGPPTIADFDADGRPEIGVAGGHAYAVFDLHRPGEDVVQPAGDAAPGPGQLYVRWSRETQDLSSNASGSSVFDFQGDGAAEVVYGDECHMRVYAGTTGAVILELESTNATIHEYPLVVDVDDDGNSEILIVANASGNNGCSGAARQGLFVYGDASDEWVPTRRVWNQHAYHVTNVKADGTVPLVEDDNWAAPGLNNYRQNVQGAGIFNAPDLQVDLSVALDACSAAEVELRARVSNQGALGVPMGVVATFYEGADASGTVLGTAQTTTPLLPGQAESVSITAPAPAGQVDYFVEVDGSGASAVAECDASNNTDLTTDASCPLIE